MTRDKWLDLKEKVEGKFQVEKFEKYEPGDVPGACIEELIFSSPLGKIKLEWNSKPRMLAEKTKYSRRIGGQVAVEKVYSDTEKAEFLKVYKWELDRWQEISVGDFQF